MRSLKYDPLKDWLKKQSASHVVLGFDEIARMVGGLPKSAEEHSAWWANERSNGGHSQCRAWLDAGYHASADRGSRKVRFARQAG